LRPIVLSDDPVGTAPIVSVRRFVTWRHASTNRRIFAAMMVVGAATVLGKVLAMAKDIVVASYFGTSDAVDAFFIAQTVPTFAISVIAGSIPAALVPIYLRVRERDGNAAAGRLLGNVVALAGTAIVLSCLLLALLAPIIMPIVGARFGGDKLALTRHLYLLVLPGVFISGVSGMLAGVLNAHERFLLAALTPALMSVLSIAFLVAAADHWGISALAIGLTTGYAAELMVLAWSVRARHLAAPPRWASWRDPDVQRVLGQYAPLVIGGAVMSSSPLIDQAMAASLGSGSVAQLAYGSKIVAAGLGIGGTVLSTAIFPHFSRMVARHDWSGLRHTLRVYTRVVLVAGVAVVLPLVLFSEPIVRLLFERGNFLASDTQGVARVQALYALQIPFYVLGILGVQLLHAISANRVLMWVSIGNFFTNIIGNYIFMRVWGVAGIAFATSMVYFLSMVVLLTAVWKRLGDLKRESLPPHAAQPSSPLP
jgi:putative peptidoglycan lipid II flippase